MIDRASTTHAQWECHACQVRYPTYAEWERHTREWHPAPARSATFASSAAGPPDGSPLVAGYRLGILLGIVTALAFYAAVAALVIRWGL